ncbi:MAG: hypothetical protein IT347_12235 [Candidatus Eisenbacteria bacterium]|nr:hypothetical protein [Candidatus Eisenbacteria bacterium]
MSKRHSIHELLAALLLVVPGLAPATTLGHGFSYQGQLSRSGVPVQGNVALRFSLWDAAGSGDPPTGGNQVGTVQTLTSVPVSGGIFSVVLNAGNEFGSQAFNGEARWLQVEVCADTTCSAVTVLGPRQAITGAPYALGPWQMNGTNLGYLGGNVGIGTATPGRPLHIRANQPAMVLEDSAAPLQQSGFISFQNATTETGWMGYGSAGSPDMTFANARPGGDMVFWDNGEKMRVDTGGNVGIGTSAPTSKLEVRGDIRMGASGQWLAPASEEALRIVRGEVLAAGSINEGSGFRVTHPATGIYNIIFDTPFLATHHTTLSVTPVANSGTLIAMASSLPGPALVALRIVNGSGTATDGAFSFTVIGVR